MQKQERITLYGMDCRDAMGLFMAENSVDSVITDPPYGLGFMGKEWDHGVPGVEFWKHAYDVLKPGGHLLAFSGSRTYHRMVCAIEDAGFEIRDQIARFYTGDVDRDAFLSSLSKEQEDAFLATFGRPSTMFWTYGSGFPKSLDVSKAIDKAAGAERAVVGVDPSSANRKSKNDTAAYGDYAPEAERLITAPATDAARQWQGWGTALKPAHEPICVARKPLIGTVAANVLHWGTGALNIDACRVATDDVLHAPQSDPHKRGAGAGEYCVSTRDTDVMHAAQRASIDRLMTLGRWPANLIHDGSDEVLSAFPDSKGQQGDLTGHTKTRGNGIYGDMAPAHDAIARIETETSAARFFYCAKASKKDRDEGMDDAPDLVLAMSNQAKAELARGNMHVGDSGINSAKVRKNNHPTVKPTDLMAYLCRLVTPPGGVVLDPFMGSGSTGKAALREGFRFIGCELDDGYMAIAAARLAAEVAA